MKSSIVLKDNSEKTLNSFKDDSIVSKLRELSFKTINDDNLILFSNSIDLENHNKIFDIYDNTIKTSNLMGFISYNDLSIKISSRFASNDDKDYFLHYMLSRVFNINITNLDFYTKPEINTFDFLLYYLFIYHLKKALNQGLYKKYKRVEYNDSKVKGVINLSKQIKYNMPFNGRIYYTAREYSFDNEITQLIRHTIEYLKTKDIFREFISNTSKELKEYINKIIQATPSYNKKERFSIINKNIKKLSHPYFYEYEPLRRVCIKILKKETLKYDTEKDKVYGILFDGAYLWEEYLATVLRNVIHSENKSSKNGIYLLRDKDNEDKGLWKVYPDFYKNDSVVLDAKYKRLDGNNIGSEDKHQIVSYAYTLNAKRAYFIYPSSQLKSRKNEIGKLKNIDCEVGTFAFAIPSEYNSFVDFIYQIEKSEDLLKNMIK